MLLHDGEPGMEGLAVYDHCHDTFLVQDGQTLVFIGDSITDCGRRDQAFPFGSGYVRFAIDLITARYPDRGITYHNQGIGGDVSTGLLRRWNGDVLDHQPDWVSVMIGINDLHTHLRASPEGVSPERFAELYDEILGITRDELGQLPIVLLTPFYISTERGSDTMRGRVQELLPSYIDTVVSMSQKYDTRLVQLHDVFQRHLQYRDADTFWPEPVHPNHTGHTIIAQAVVDELS